jgi:hypothetical protein
MMTGRRFEKLAVGHHYISFKRLSLSPELRCGVRDEFDVRCTPQYDYWSLIVCRQSQTSFE